MDKIRGHRLLQAQISSAGLYRLFNVCFGVLFFGLVLLITFNNQRTIYDFSLTRLIAVAIVAIALMWVFMRFFSGLPPLSKRSEILYVAGFFAIFIALQATLGWQMRLNINDTWDFGEVYMRAENFVLNGALPEDYYFEIYTVNKGIYLIWCGFFSLLKLFGIQSFYLPTFILNIVSIDLSVLLLYLCARKLFGGPRAQLALLLAVATPVFLFYVPVFYTDTLTLPVPILAVYLWLNARKSWRGGNMRGALLRFCLLSLAIGLLSVVKTTVAIVYIAIVIDLVILLNGKRRFVMLLAGLALTAGVFTGGSWLASNNSAMPQFEYEQVGFPLSTWVMMGLSGNGGYNDDEFALVNENATTLQERKAFVSEEIQRRLSDMGPLGLVAHLGNKLSYTFGEGTYTTADKLNRSTAMTTVFHDIFIVQAKYLKYWAYFTFGLQVAMYFWMAVGALRAAQRKNDALSFVRVAIFGLVLVLLIWETRARYLTNYLPLFLLCFIEFLPLARKEKPQLKPALAPEPEPEPEPQLPPQAEPERAAEPMMDNLFGLE